ncbi:MAG: hypothetical protein HY235_22670 [Acidobacteria bacterium]|nr:hypothetical protein [Acidobacteriota bacterium]
MLYRIALVCFTGLLLGADKKPITGQGANDRMSLQAIAYITKDEVKQALGADPGASIVVLEVSVSPRGGKPVAISKDDFLLRSYKDGQKSQPFAPSQIAGKGGLQLSESGGGGAIMGDRGGPIWGGIGGGPPPADGGRWGRDRKRGRACGHARRGHAEQR